MPLPEIVTPVYSLTVPSTKKKIKYRPFLVKEQKVLIIAMESQDQEQILDAITTILKNCINTRIKVCLLYTSPSPRDLSTSRMPSSA